MYIASSQIAEQLQQNGLEYQDIKIVRNRHGMFFL